MAITLAEAKNNVQTAYDPFVIDEFRKINPMMDLLPFDDAVNPSGGGGTLTYGYRRLATQPTAATRAINSEYTPANVTTTKHNVDLAVMGGSFEVDRVIARNLGAGDSTAVDLNLRQKVKATGAKFNDLVINGDVASDANGFDGLDKALTGSSTELSAFVDWSAPDTAGAANLALDLLDEALGLLDGAATFIIGNKKMLARVRGIVRRSGMYVRDPFEDLIGQNGRPIERENYGGVYFIDAGDKPGTSTPVIPIYGKTIETVAQTGLTDLYIVRAELDGFHGVTTVGSQMVETFLPDFSTAGAVKKGEVELGPVAVALKATKAAAVIRNVKVQ